MMYDSWNTRDNRQNFLSFWAIFCHFENLTKTPGEIIILHTSTINDNHLNLMYGS